MKSCKKECKNITSIGGQAVIEGVMMRGKSAQATAVRAESGRVLIETERVKAPSKIAKVPVIRGAVAFFNSLVGGTKTLMRSASVFGEEETSSFDNWLSEKLKINPTDLAVYLGAFLGILLSLALFFFLPQAIADLFTPIKDNALLYSLVEGLIRIAIFISYILLTSLLKDVRRTYMYHGAEHKTISCYEEGLELNVQNVRKCPRVHDRCGTTFLFIVMTISILLFALVNALFAELGVTFDGFSGKMLRFGVKILLLPLVAGVSYEILKLLSKTKSKFFYIFKAPGLLLQRITTREPDDDMIEVAITAFNKVLEMDADETIEVVKFDVFGSTSTLLKKVSSILEKGKCYEACDAEWIVARVCNISRSEVNGTNSVTKEQNDLAVNYAKERAKGVPLQYVFGDTDFYGYTFKVNENVLIPRPETEELVMHALKFVDEKSSVLDMCTGSGAIAVTVSLKANVYVDAVDVSELALGVAKENANTLGAKVNFIQSNAFEKVEGKYNLIISNPPYIKSEDVLSLDETVKKEPSLALDGGKDGLDFYKILAKSASEYLCDNGTVIMECGINQANDVVNIFKLEDKYTNFEIIKDINGIDRIVKVDKK